jgi:phosphoribosylformylglycinamidine (FGAM) synthase PurS component
MPESILVSVISAHGAQKKQVQRYLAEARVKSAACQKINAIYRLEGEVPAEDVEKIARELLCDPVVEKCAIDPKPASSKIIFADVWYKPGVTDAVGDSVLKAIRDLGVWSVRQAAFGTRYEFALKGSGKGGAEKQISEFVNQRLLNGLVQECKIAKRS